MGVVDFPKKSIGQIQIDVEEQNGAFYVIMQDEENYFVIPVDILDFVIAALESINP